MSPMMNTNPLDLAGIDFVEFASPDPEALHRLFLAFGFSRVARHVSRAVDLYVQNEIVFLLNREPGSHGAAFARMHGPSICSMGWRVDHAHRAAEQAEKRGATLSTSGDFARNGERVPAVRGIGGSLIYLVDRYEDPRRWESFGFVDLDEPDRVEPKGFLAIDHLTNNVEKGTMQRWASFYKDVFGFTEVRYFDIRGMKTGLTSYALRSPCGTFCIPINEADEAKSQINEFIDEYRGPGIQHLAFLTNDILSSLAKLEGAPIRFLDIDDEYYTSIFDRVPGVSEDKSEIRRRNVLVDGDEQGYLLQIFTQPLCGPIFIELIQRKNHLSFGEGNFGALFRSIERDQARRGVFDAR
ncbi:MAG: 4-hydroxyphenylpyruvate dioxygenase [Labilithrix sp.]